MLRPTRPETPDGAVAMHERVNELMDRIAGQAKNKAGEMLEISRLEREGRARARQAEAEEFETMAQEHRNEDASLRGQQMAQPER